MPAHTRAAAGGGGRPGSGSLPGPVLFEPGLTGMGYSGSYPLCYPHPNKGLLSLYVEIFFRKDCLSIMIPLKEGLCHIQLVIFVCQVKRKQLVTCFSGVQQQIKSGDWPQRVSQHQYSMAVLIGFL